MSGAVAISPARAVDAGIFAAHVEWQAVALGLSEWPEECGDAPVTLFLEGAFGGADYLLGADAQGGWRLWRMDDEWRFVGAFGKWPDQWTKV